MEVVQHKQAHNALTRLFMTDTSSGKACQSCGDESLVNMLYEEWGLHGPEAQTMAGSSQQLQRLLQVGRLHQRSLLR